MINIVTAKKHIVSILVPGKNNAHTDREIESEPRAAMALHISGGRWVVDLAQQTLELSAKGEYSSSSIVRGNGQS